MYACIEFPKNVDLAKSLKETVGKYKRKNKVVPALCAVSIFSTEEELDTISNTIGGTVEVMFYSGVSDAAKSARLGEDTLAVLVYDGELAEQFKLDAAKL